VGKQKGVSNQRRCIQPLGYENVLKWAGGQDEGPLGMLGMADYDSVALYAPLPLGVNISPKEVLSMSSEALKRTAETLQGLRDKEPDRYGPMYQDIAEVVHNREAFALKPLLLELWDFHWRFKSEDKTFVKLAQVFREYYLRKTWPIWIWVVQIVRLNRPVAGKDTVDWSSSTVAGEVLIDATASSGANSGGVFLIRIKQTIADIDPNADEPYKRFEVPDVEYPLC